MKHHKLVSRTPQVAQTNLDAKLDFLMNAYNHLLAIVGNLSGGSLKR